MEQSAADSLPGADKHRIWLEEQYRFAARVQFEQSKPEKSKASSFLNSSFGLWLLSAIFISAAGSVYTEYQNREKTRAQNRENERVEETRRKELGERLDLEISHRLGLAMARLAAIEQATKGQRQVKRTSNHTVEHALAPFSLPASDRSPPLFPEFKAYSGLALIAELRRHVSKGEQVRLKKVLANLSGLLARLESQPDRPAIIGTKLLSIMKSPRWDNGFHYTDCPIKQPFC
jgi:hypothetical protein